MKRQEVVSTPPCGDRGTQYSIRHHLSIVSRNEIAGAAVFLAYEAGAYVTGQTITFDGGMAAMA